LVIKGAFLAREPPGAGLLKDIADAHDTTAHQLALRFLVRRPSLFAIPKASSPKHAAENARAGDLRLTEADLARIDEAFPLGQRTRTRDVALKEVSHGYCGAVRSSGGETRKSESAGWAPLRGLREDAA